LSQSSVIVGAALGLFFLHIATAGHLPLYLAVFGFGGTVTNHPPVATPGLIAPPPGSGSPYSPIGNFPGT
jgi:hypothetical protein